MKAPRSKQQTGYALLLMVLALMGIGGVVVVGFTQGAKQEVDQQRFLHNQRVLEEAKHALLMYAYRYPETAWAFNGTVRGPGRMPCPDADNNGTPDPLTNCISAGDAVVGRFPWAANGMNFHDIRDASGQRLWYAVSQNYNNFDALDVINSDTYGTITVHDQTGALLYDGSAAGIAAVIIAPGPTIDRNGVAQDRSVGNGDNPFDTIADTDPGIIDPINYLDISGARDNADFTNNSAVDGFILGPVDDLAADELIVNDQMILITVEEVIAFAEKAVLSAYRDAIDTYQQNIWGLTVADYRYPWLDAYDSVDGLTTFDADITSAAPTPVIGRVPSIFTSYFATNNNDSQIIRSEMNMLLDVNGHPVDARAVASLVPDIFFKQNGNLVSSFNNGASFTGFVWDGHLTNLPTLPNDGIWEACPYVTGTEEDCNQDVAGNFIGGIASDVWLRVRQVTFTFNGAIPFEFQFVDKTANALTYTPPEAANHATVSAEYLVFSAGYFSSIIWIQDNDFESSFSEEPVGNNGSLSLVAGDTITVGLRYYPELPRWAWRNGWHDMVQAAYSSALQPDGDGTCNAGVDDCLTLQGVPGVTNDKIGLLVLSGNEGDGDPLNTALTDLGGGPLYFADDLGLIFEGENNTPDLVFDQRSPNTNDVVLLLE